MANLIITIISIALVAVAAIMGAYYGGRAFLEGQVKAQINMIVNDLNHIAAAAQLYFTDRGGNTIFPGGAYNTVVSTYLIPNYMQSISRVHYNNATGNLLIYAFNKSTGTLAGQPNAFAANTAAVYTQTWGDTNDNGLKLCQKWVEVIGSNQAAYGPRTPPTYTFQVSPSDIAAGKRWFCIFRDEDSSGTPTTGDVNFYFLYMFL